MKSFEDFPNVAEYVHDYEFRGDTDYRPTEAERILIEDAIHGYIASIEEERG